MHHSKILFKLCSQGRRNSNGCQGDCGTENCASSEKDKETPSPGISVSCTGALSQIKELKHVEINGDRLLDKLF